MGHLPRPEVCYFVEWVMNKYIILFLLILWPVSTDQRGSPKEMNPPVERNDSKKEMNPPVEHKGSDKEMFPPVENDGKKKEMATPVETPFFSQLKVCASGCAYTNAQLQEALYAAMPGDEVLLESGHTYVGPDQGFVLGAQCSATPAWDCITVRTGVTSTGTVMPRGSFPADGIRMSTAYRGTLAKLLPGVNNSPSIRTIFPGETGPTCSTEPCNGDGWTIKWLEFGPKPDYFLRQLIRLGSNNAGKNWNGSCVTWPDPTPSCWTNEMPNGNTQDMLNEVPRYLSLIQNDIHGDPVGGQHQGLVLATKDARILHNSFSDIKSMTETQALTGLNGLGPYDIQNNLFEATGENVMFGGADTYLQLQATVSGSPTTTVITLASPVWVHMEGTTTAANLATDMYSGIFISIVHAGTTYSGMTCTLSGSTCTLSKTLPFTPSVGDLVKWDWLPGGITFKYNHVRKKIEWFGPIVPAPTGVTATAGSGGSLSAGSHCYQVIAFVKVSGGEPDAWSGSSTEQCALTNASGSVTINWSAVPNATRYWVYGNGTTGTENKYWEVIVPTVTYLDTGTGGTAATPPTATGGAVWTVKNNFELKNAEGGSPMGPSLVQGNIFDRSWCCTQSNLLAIKVNNQASYDDSATVRNLTIRDNWGRHMNRAIALSCTTTGSDTPNPSGFMSNVVVTNNLFTDMASDWKNPPGGESNTPILVTSGDYPTFIGARGCLDTSFTHNTFLARTDDMNGPMWFNLNASTDLMTNFILRNNIMARDCVPQWCIDAGNASLKTYNPSNVGLGTTAWNAAVTGSSFADHNAWPDGASGTYTSGPFTNSFFPTDAALKSTHLMNYTACTSDADITGCVLASGSSMHLAGSDSTDIGANIATIKTFTDIALSGDLSGGEPPPPDPPPGPQVPYKARLRIRIR